MLVNNSLTLTMRVRKTQLLADYKSHINNNNNNGNNLYFEIQRLWNVKVEFVRIVIGFSPDFCIWSQ